MSTTLTVRDLCDAVRGAVEDTFPDEVWIQGAISGLSRSANGHVYFDLIDPIDEFGSASGDVVPVALFAANRQLVNRILKRSGGIRMHDGVEIRVRGRVRFYAPQGRIQLVMSLIDPAYTVGRMAMARAALVETLRSEGLLHANRLLDLPLLPLRVGLVTSGGSAAHADFGDELATSGYRFQISLFDTRVQGADAVDGLTWAITEAGRADVDVVVVVRGGGARTDLAAFDHQRVARAIAACPRPVLVGVGHEIDRSVADEVAHTSAKTPTATAAVLVSAVRDVEDRVEQAASRLAVRAGERLDRARTAISADGRRLIQASERALERGTVTLMASTDRLAAGSGRAGDRADDRLQRCELRLRGLDPARTAERGWSITHTAAGHLVRRADEVPIGATLVTTLASGRVTSTVTARSSDDDPVPATGPGREAPDHDQPTEER